ncbi:MAG: AmmeMemoRadiSam system radical SAM enzyme [bacterium]|nr:AmmeMemoRadiSam system radical SAM enzyme [bacterium]
MKEALYYETMENGDTRCKLCPHNCLIHADGYGVCGTRKNIDAKLYTEIYGELTASAMDPIEKKPLYHFHPGSSILSIGTRGCNFKCPYCQNWNISQDLSANTSYHSPEDIVTAAANQGSVGIAYTYSEPSIWFEYVLDTARLARKKGLKNVLVTNGFINKEPLLDLLEYTDAMNIDLKAFKPETYKKVQKGNLEAVLETIKTAYEKGCHVEITTLIVTGVNDTIEEMTDIIDFIASIDKNIAWHISRYHPSYKYTKSATDIDFILNVHNEGMKKLNFVYCGNVPSSYGGSDTVCPSCHTVVVSRSGYFTRVEFLQDGKCSKCGTVLGIKGE